MQLLWTQPWALTTTNTGAATGNCLIASKHTMSTWPPSWSTHWGVITAIKFATSMTSWATLEHSTCMVLRSKNLYTCSLWRELSWTQILIHIYVHSCRYNASSRAQIPTESILKWRPEFKMHKMNFYSTCLIMFPYLVVVKILFGGSTLILFIIKHSRTLLIKHSRPFMCLYITFTAHNIC